MADRAGFDEYVATRATALLRLANMLTRDWAAAEDLLQEALARAYLAWPRVYGDPEAYVKKIMVNVFARQRQRRRWSSELVMADLPERVATAGDEVVERDALWRALGRLPERQRAVVVLRYYEDLPEAAVAKLLGCSVGTVKSQTAKAVAKLRADTSLELATEGSAR